MRYDLEIDITRTHITRASFIAVVVTTRKTRGHSYPLPSNFGKR